mmetsp:Transcript_27802/g.50512  ORF Transcript_27802/g.50512 Transcript_27802/m.50512 type:complete len:401 (-) Transcript_27802:96-1298(-)
MANIHVAWPESKPKKHVAHYNIMYDESFEEVCGLKVKVAVATFTKRGEDRHSFVTSMNEPCLLKSHTLSGSFDPALVGFVGIFDGHDGVAASRYCAEGLVQHIVSETTQSIQEIRFNKRGDILDENVVGKALDSGLVKAYTRAHDRFGSNFNPPTWDDVHQGVHATRIKKSTFCTRLCSNVPIPPRGGTTALSLCMYGKREYNGIWSALPYAVVANTGDCRLLSDDGTGTSSFRQVNSIHRPSESAELKRLKHQVRRGNASIQKDPENSILRIHPGGLSVSRSIGDFMWSSAIICTPDIFHIPLHFTKKRDDGEHTVSRIIMASDGLWDVCNIHEIGKIAARKQIDNVKNGNEQRREGSQTVVIDPKESVKRVMKHCLLQGGSHDDVTIIILDITWSDIP